jgi:hypothetical protein
VVGVATLSIKSRLSLRFGDRDRLAPRRLRLLFKESRCSSRNIAGPISNGWAWLCRPSQKAGDKDREPFEPIEIPAPTKDEVLGFLEKVSKTPDPEEGSSAP